MSTTATKTTLKVLTKADLTRTEWKEIHLIEEPAKMEWREYRYIFEKKGDAAALDFAKKHMKDSKNKKTALRGLAPTAKQKAASAKNRAAIEGPISAELRKVQEKMWTQECFKNPASMGKSQRKEDTEGLVCDDIKRLYNL